MQTLLFKSFTPPPSATPPAHANHPSHSQSIKSQSRANAKNASQSEETSSNESFEDVLNQTTESGSEKKTEETAEATTATEVIPVVQNQTQTNAPTPSIVLPLDLLLANVQASTSETETTDSLEGGEEGNAQTQTVSTLSLAGTDDGTPVVTTATQLSTGDTTQDDAANQQLTSEEGSEDSKNQDVKSRSENVSHTKKSKSENSSSKADKLEIHAKNTHEKAENALLAALEKPKNRQNEFGILNALKQVVSNSLNLLNTPQDTAALESTKPVEANVQTTSTAPTLTLPEIRTPVQPEPVRLVNLIERVQHAAEMAKPPRTQQLSFQVTPPNLGTVTVDLQWTGKSWSVKWSVSQNEVREWLNQQLPALQQDNRNEKAPMVWHPPTLNNGFLNMSGQERSRYQQGKTPDQFLSEEEREEDEQTSTSTGFWA
jgi:hypothetical protein